MDFTVEHHTIILLVNGDSSGMIGFNISSISEHSNIYNHKNKLKKDHNNTPSRVITVYY